jgi:hypothetical protein
MHLTKLLDEVKRQKGFHSSIATTFSVDGAFYDSGIERRLNRDGCRNNILMADAKMLAASLVTLPEAFSHAGRRYAVAPARARGCFHPKLLLRLGERRARLSVSSANATAAGWCRNLELVGTLAWDAKGEAPDNVAHGQLIRKAFNYLLPWMRAVPGDAMEHKLALLSRDSAWLSDIQANTEPVTLADSTRVDLLLERGNGHGVGILEQLRANIGDGQARRVVLVSPFWDAEAQAIEDIARSFPSAEIVVGLPDRRPNFPAHVDFSHLRLRLTRLPQVLGETRDLHAKLVVVQSDEGDHVLFGSANISRAALGAPGQPGRNAEACVYRHFPRGEVLSWLGLELDQPFDRSLLPAVRPEPEPDGEVALLPGTVELDEQRLRWWPTSNDHLRSAVLLLAGGAEHPVHVGGNGQGIVDIPSTPSWPLIVRFRLADGRQTLPCLVHDPKRLWLTSPGSYGGATALVSGFEHGRFGIMDLAELANQLFERPVQASGGGGKGSTGQEHNKHYDTEEEFRRETEDTSRKHVIGGRTAQGVWSGHPIQALASRIAMGCLTGALDPRAERERELREEEDLAAGEDEDGEHGATPDPAGSTADTEQEPPTAPLSRHDEANAEARRRRQYDKRRRLLLRALKLFDAWLTERVLNRALPVDDVPAKAAFMLRLLHEAARLRLDSEMAAYGPLLSELPVGKDRLSGTTTLVVSLLERIWASQRGLPPLAQRLDPEALNARDRTDAEAFARYSRWAVVRSLLLVEGGGPSLSTLPPILTRPILAILPGTYLVAPDDPNERENIKKLEASIGGDPALAEAVFERLRQLRRPQSS